LKPVALDLRHDVLWQAGECMSLSTPRLPIVNDRENISMFETFVAASLIASLGSAPA
jgi:hypothetical protein